MEKKKCKICSKNNRVLGLMICFKCHSNIDKAKYDPVVRNQLMQDLTKLRIKQFIKGQLPIGISKYDTTGERAEECPMCRKQHYYYKNFNNNDDVVRDMFEDNDDIANIRDSSYYFYMCEPCYRYYEVVKSNREDEIEDSEDTQYDLDFSKKYGTEAGTRLTRYIKYGELDPSHEWLRLVGIVNYLCYFCREALSQSPAEYPMLYPVSTGSFGAVLYVCEDCYGKTSGKLNRHYKNYKVEKCIKCNTDYPITSAEYEARYALPNPANYICPACFYSTYSALYSDNKAENLVKIERFLHSKCPDCSSIVSLDRCNFTSAIPSINDFKDKFTKKVYCSDCFILRSFTFSVTTGIPTEYWLGVATTHPVEEHVENNWFYVIYKCIIVGTIKNSIEVLRKEGFKDSFEATVEGTKALQEHYDSLFK